MPKQINYYSRKQTVMNNNEIFEHSLNFDFLIIFLSPTVY